VTLGIAVGVAFSTIAVLARRVRIASAVVAALELWRRSHPASAERRAEVAALEDRVFGFTSRHPGRVPALLALEGVYQMAGVMEIWLASPSLPVRRSDL